jgi:hypothetical protein
VKIDQYLRPEAHLGSLGLGAQLLRLAVVMHPKNIENRMVHFHEYVINESFIDIQ